MHLTGASAASRASGMGFRMKALIPAAVAPFLIASFQQTAYSADERLTHSERLRIHRTHPLAKNNRSLHITYDGGEYQDIYEFYRQKLGSTDGLDIRVRERGEEDTGVLVSSA